MDSTALRGFRKLCITTLIGVYFLILVGAVVRTTGSGMGCPDWPKCFGSWMPPNSVTQLPDNYKEVYASVREKKNKKFAKYLTAIGLTATANQIANGKAVLAETDFNVVKAWIEYGNRLVGVIIGFLIVGLSWQSLKLKKSHPSIFFFSVATLIAVVVQGWFGSIVVSTNLTTWTVTIHMFLALLIVVLLIYLISLSEDLGKSVQTIRNVRWLLVACMVALLVQVFLGTQVRESLDTVASMLAQRSQWIEALGLEFIIHRSFSLIVLALNFVLLLKLRQTLMPKPLSGALIILILGTLLTGIGMAYWAVPAILQPVHLVLATGALGIQFHLFFRLSTLHDKKEIS